MQQEYLPRSFGHSSGPLFQRMHPLHSAAASTTVPFCREFQLEYTVSQTTDWPSQSAVSSVSSTSACHSNITNAVLTNKLAIAGTEITKQFLKQCTNSYKLHHFFAEHIKRQPFYYDATFSEQSKKDTVNTLLVDGKAKSRVINSSTVPQKFTPT